MTQQLQILRMYMKNEPSGFTTRLIENSLKYLIEKYIFRKKFSTQKIHNYKMSLDLNDPGISRTLFLVNDREREHAYLLKHIAKPSNTILDLGANIGYYALMESKIVGEEGKIIAIEPHPSNFELLNKNINLNKAKNITSTHAAVTDHDGTTKLHLSKLSNVHSVLPSVNYTEEKSIDVPSVSIATILKQYKKIDIIRMDIEGFETVILESIIKINKHKKFTPSILFELHAKKYREGQMETILKNMSQAGFKISYLATSNKNLIKKLNIPIVISISTDGKIRHILENISTEQAIQLIPSARCLVLSAS